MSDHKKPPPPPTSPPKKPPITPLSPTSKPLTPSTSSSSTTSTSATISTTKPSEVKKLTPSTASSTSPKSDEKKDEKKITLVHTGITSKDVNNKLKSGVGKQISNIREGLQSDEKLAESIEALSRATGNKRSAKKYSKNKETINTLLESLKNRPKFSKMVEYSLECLKNLAVDEASIDELLDEGVLEVLTTIRQLNPYNEKIQRMLNATLSSFAVNERLAGLVGKTMGAEAILFFPQKAR